jgi:phosphatidylglycerophosphatase A
MLWVEVSRVEDACAGDSVREFSAGSWQSRDMNRILIWLATGFGLGLSPFASGTVGALLGIPLTYLVHGCPLWWGHLVSCVVLTALAVPICDAAEKTFGRKDDGRIVADEYLLLPIAFIGLPLTPLMVAVGFVVSRAMDVIKPWPARGLQKVTGGLGVVIDDFFASLYAMLINHAIYALFQSSLK